MFAETARPLRVLMLVPKYPPPVLGGFEKQSALLSEELSLRGCCVTVLSYAFSEDHRIDSVINGVRIIRIRQSNNPLAKIFYTSIVMMWVITSLRRNIDVIHVHNHSFFGTFGLALGRILRIPTLFKLSNVGERGIPGLQTTMVGRVQLAVLRVASAIVAMSPESVDELDNIGYPPGRVFFRPNGIRVAAGATPDRRYCRPKVIISFVGRLSVEKRVDDLLEAWARTGRAQATARLEIVGDGPERERLVQLADRLGISESVAFLGHRSDVDDILAASDVFVLPSHIEGNSNAVLEAMHSGLPIVATNLSGTSLQVGSFGAALLFQRGDVEHLSLLLDAVSADSELRRHYGAAMHKRVCACFSMDLVASEYEQAYRELVYRRPARMDTIANPAWWDLT